jgi:hypothetical protein
MLEKCLVTNSHTASYLPWPNFVPKSIDAAPLLAEELALASAKVKKCGNMSAKKLAAAHAKNRVQRNLYRKGKKSAREKEFNVALA